MTHKILLLITGSVAAYKSLELIRLLKRENLGVSAILTQGGAEFITPLAVSSLSGTPTYSDLFSLKDEVEMGHIRLTREHDLVVVAPASADFMAKMAAGRADDLASATVLASAVPVLVAPAMNHCMWDHPATRRNLGLLQADGITIIPPSEGEMACGEEGIGRMVEPQLILEHIKLKLMGVAPSRAAHAPAPQAVAPVAAPQPQVSAPVSPSPAILNSRPLQGRRALVTSGPTQEAIDPVRFISNQSSGKQGHAIAQALAEAGAEVTLISGPVSEPTPDGVKLVRVTSAEQMFNAVMRDLPTDIVVCAAAVADWTVATPAEQKIKKGNKQTPQLIFSQTRDILAAVSQHPSLRPPLVIGFAAETQSVISHAISKRRAKGCDWLLANDVSRGYVFGSDDTQLTFVTQEGTQTWRPMTKHEAAQELTTRIIQHFGVAQLHSPTPMSVTQTAPRGSRKVISTAPVPLNLEALPTKSAQVRVLAAQGMSRADISRRLGIDYALVAAALRPTKRRQQMTEIETGLAIATSPEAKVRFLTSKGYSAARISRTIGISLEEAKRMRKRRKAKKSKKVKQSIKRADAPVTKPQVDTRFHNQTEHIRHLAEIGMSRAEIAKLLGIRYQTVRNALVPQQRNNQFHLLTGGDNQR